MRKYILMILVALTAASCATLRAPAKLERFVDRVERNADRYRPYQWDRVNRQYEALLREYVQQYRTYSIAEKQLAMAAIGRYHGILDVDFRLRSLGAYAGGLLDLLKQDAGAVTDFLQSVLGLTGNELNRWMNQLKNYAE